MTFTNAHMACIDILEEWGINPDDVLLLDITEDGYLRHPRAGENLQVAEGWVIQQDERPKKREAWPEGFPVDRFMNNYNMIHFV